MGNKASSSGSICRILVVGSKSGDDCLTELSKLPPQAKIMATAETLEELIEYDNGNGNDFRQCNVLFNGIIICHHHYFIITSSLLHHYFIITSSLLHHYFVITSSLLHHYFIITSSLLHHYFVITSSF